jgi:hypothetical protein
MRRLFATALICLLASGNLAAAQPVPPAPAGQPAVEPARAPIPGTLLDGTAIKLRLGENLSSETNKTGDQVPFEVIDEVSVDGITVIPKGAQALTTVTHPTKDDPAQKHKGAAQ